MSQHPDTLLQCPMARAMDLVGGRWRLVILHFLRQQPHRFKELERGIGSISPKMLTLALDELARDGLLTRSVSEQKPLKVEYALTAKGQLTIPILDALIQFGLQLPGETTIPTMVTT